MNIFNFIPRVLPKSIQWQLQAFADATEVEHEEVFPERELTPEQVRQVNLIQAWATRQRNLIYDELNKAVKDARVHNKG